MVRNESDLLNSKLVECHKREDKYIDKINDLRKKNVKLSKENLKLQSNNPDPWGMSLIKKDQEIESLKEQIN